MKRIVMHPTAVADVFDPEQRAKIRAIKLGGADGINVVMVISRVGFKPMCQYPFTPYTGKNGESYPGSSYNLIAYNELHDRSFTEVLQECQTSELLLIVTLFNEVSIRNGNPMCWNQYGNDVANFRKRPQGTWAAIIYHWSRHIIQMYVKSPLRPVIFNPSLEGTSSADFETFVYESVTDILPAGSIVISNCKQFVKRIMPKGLHSFIYSPHCHNLANLRENAVKGGFPSDDGMKNNSPEKISAGVKTALGRGCVAYESLLAGALSGELVLDTYGHTATQDKRVRPRLAQLNRGITREMITALTLKV